MYFNSIQLRFNEFSQTSDGRSDSRGGSGTDGPGTSSNSLSTSSAVPDTNRLALDRVLSISFLVML